MRRALVAVIVALLLVPGWSFAGEIEDLHQKVLYPTVRVRAEEAGGSGVIFASIKNQDRYETYILTNHHVIEGAIKISEEWSPLERKEIKKETRATVEVEIFKYMHMSQATGTLLIQADIMEWNKQHDLAILKLRSDERIEPAKLYPNGKENDLRIFMPVYVCGAGLGRPPFPTSGEISSLTDEIDNLPFWMLNAPAVFGNSGGGAFLASTKEFIGVPSRGAVTFIGWSPNAVYHMNYIIPITRIYKWLDETGWTCLVDPKAQSHEDWLKAKKEEAKK